VQESNNTKSGSANMVVGEVTLNKKSTPFRTAGNWIVYVSFIATGLMIAFSFIKKNQPVT
jgi:hypothetical protein